MIGRYITKRTAELLSQHDWDAISAELEGPSLPPLSDYVSEMVRKMNASIEKDLIEAFGGDAGTVTTTSTATPAAKPENLTIEKIQELVSMAKKVAPALGSMNTEYLLPRRFKFEDDYLVPNVEPEPQPEPTPEGYGQW